MIAAKIGIALAAAAIVAAFGSGVWVRDAFCDAADARRSLAAEQSKRRAIEFDLGAAQESIAFGVNGGVEIERRDTQRQERIRELETWIAKNGEGRCRLGADGVRRLLDISPR